MKPKEILVFGATGQLGKSLIRKLTDKQLTYAAKDVIYLHKISSALKEILIREKRYELYVSSIKYLQTRVDLDLASFTEDIWSH